MKKYYWAIFYVETWLWKANGQSLGKTEQYSQEFIDTHPLKMQLELNDKYGVEHDDPAGAKFGRRREHFELLNWKEISEEEYIEFEGTV